jgi:hypothetical protein
MPRILTANSTQDEYTDLQYRDMYEQLRSPEGQRLSSRAFVRHINSSLSHAMWEKYDKNPSTLTRRMKNELRTAMQLPLLPPTIEEVLSGIDPDATVMVLDETESSLELVVIGKRLDKRWPKLVEVSMAHNGRKEQLGVRPWDVIEASLANEEEAMILGGKN